MVELLRNKTISGTKAEDVSSVGLAIAKGVERLGKAFESRGEKIIKDAEKKRKIAEESEKITATDIAGQAENELLRWNEENRDKNPAAVGTREYEEGLRNKASEIANKFGGQLGDHGRAVLAQASSRSVNQITKANVNYANSEKVKNGEKSAENLATDLSEAARYYGMNQDTAGYKSKLTENSETLKKYISKVNPYATNAAMYELHKKSLTNYIMGETDKDPLRAAAILKSEETFKDFIPDEMLENVQNIYSDTAVKRIDDQIIRTRGEMAMLPAKSPAARQYEKQIKELEKQKSELGDFHDESISQIRKEIADDVRPFIEKKVGMNALDQMKRENAEKVFNAEVFITNPTDSELKKMEDYVSTLPDDQRMTAEAGIKLMKEYRNHYGDVSLVPVTSFAGTEAMLKGMAAIIQEDADGNGQPDNIIAKGYEALNTAKKAEISQADYENYQKMVTNLITNANFRAEIAAFDEARAAYAPNLAIADGKDLVESRKYQTAKARAFQHAMKNIDAGMPIDQVNETYLNESRKAFDDAALRAGVNMSNLRMSHAAGKPAVANIKGAEYEYSGDDSNGNPLFSLPGIKLSTDMSRIKK